MSGDSLFSSRYRAVTLGIVLIITLMAFESLAVSTAMPTAVGELRGLDYYSWPFTAFLVTSVIGMVIGGERGDRYGPRGPLLAGLAVFTAGLIIAGTAPGMLVFVIGRATQGLGAGAVIVAIYVLVAETYPVALRPRAFALTSAAWVVPTLIGPLASGLITEHLTWRLVFGGLAPFVAIGLVLLWPTLRALPAHQPETNPARSNGRYAVMAAVGVATLQYGGDHVGVWTPPLVAVGLVLLVPALRVLLPAGTALLRRGLPAAIGYRGILAGSFFGIDAFLPLTLTKVHGFSPTMAGLPIATASIAWSLGSWWQGRRDGTRRHTVIRAGCGLIAGSALILVTVAWSGVTGWLAAPLWAFAGAGMGLALPSVSVLVLDRSQPADRGANSAALQICDVLGSAICVGLGGVLVAAAASRPAGTSLAVTLIDLSMAALALVGALLAARLRPASGPVAAAGT